MAEEQIAPTEEIQATPKEEEIASPVEEKKEKPWFKLLLFSILGIIVAVGLVFAGYKFGQLRQIQPGPQPTPAPEAVATPTIVATPTPDLTANWKTYTNTKYGYSIKYPKDWTMPEAFTDVFFPPSETDTAPLFWLMVEVRENPTNLVPKAWFEKEYARLWEFEKFKTSVSFKEVRISGLKGEEVTFYIDDEPLHYIFIGRKDKIYIIHLIETGEIGSKEHEDTFNLILSTFKFQE